MAIEVQQSSLDLFKFMLTWAAESQMLMALADQSMKSAIALAFQNDGQPGDAAIDANGGAALPRARA
jgi:hypothetical protein